MDGSFNKILTEFSKWSNSAYALEYLYENDSSIFSVHLSVHIIKFIVQKGQKVLASKLHIYPMVWYQKWNNTKIVSWNDIYAAI